MKWYLERAVVSDVAIETGVEVGGTGRFVDLHGRAPAWADDGDAVNAMCRDLDRGPTACGCANDQLRAAVGNIDYALYRDVGTTYREQLANGMSRGDAWDAGVRAAAQCRQESTTSIMGKTNEIGRTHRNAMKACG